MLLLDTTRKPYMVNPMTLSRVNMSDLERSMSRSLRFQSIVSRKHGKVAELSHMLLIKHL